MYDTVTRNIRVRVVPAYLAERSDPDESRYVWAYTVTIENEGEETVRLESRYWKITDQNGRMEEVRGPGVVGETPTIGPGQSYRYTSGCPLTTPSGIMAGSYRMVSETGERFDVAIPAFSLDSPHANRRLN